MIFVRSRGAGKFGSGGWWGQDGASRAGGS